MILRSDRRSRRAQQARMDAAREELETLRSALAEAYRVFNRTVDPALLEASILEISALQVRCDSLLHNIKNLNGESEYAACHRRTAGRRRGIDLPAAQASEKTDQMGV